LGTLDEIEPQKILPVSPGVISGIISYSFKSCSLQI